MFRELVRKKQALSSEECVEILKKEPRGVLSVLGDDGYPYGMPLDHWYCEEDGRLYFHSGKKGHKMDAMARCDKVSYCVYDQGIIPDGDWAPYIRSVIVFGRAQMITDYEEIIRISRRLSLKYTQDLEYIEYEVQHSGPATAVFAIAPEHISGKIVHEK